MNLTEKTERTARKRNQRHVERWPLLEISGDLHHYTADEMLDEWQRYREQLEQCDIRLSRRAEQFRRHVASLISSATLEQLDMHRAMYPPSAAYSADFWRTELKKLGADPESLLLESNDGNAAH